MPKGHFLHVELELMHAAIYILSAVLLYFNVSIFHATAKVGWRLIWFMNAGSGLWSSQAMGTEQCWGMNSALGYIHCMCVCG